MSRTQCFVFDIKNLISVSDVIVDNKNSHFTSYFTNLLLWSHKQIHFYHSCTFAIPFGATGGTVITNWVGNYTQCLSLSKKIYIYLPRPLRTS